MGIKLEVKLLGFYFNVNVCVDDFAFNFWQF